LASQKYFGNSALIWHFGNLAFKNPSAELISDSDCRINSDSVTILNAMATAFNIEPKQVRDWHDKKEQLMHVSPHIRRMNLGKLLKYPELEKKIYDWVKGLYSRNMIYGLN